MFQLVKKLFKRQSPNTGNDSDNEPKAAFHRFGQLPQEIQNLIWAYAICVDAPRAYFVDVRKLPDNPRTLEMVHSIPANLGWFPPPPASNPKGDYDLMRVCRASYQEITRCWNFYRPQVPARMILDNSHDNALRKKKLSSINIDAASDLVIVERWCHSSDRVSGIQGARNYLPLWMSLMFDGLRGIQSVAIPVDKNLNFNDHSPYLAYVKAAFPDIKTLYFCVRPAQLVRYKWSHVEMPAFLRTQPRPGKEVFRARGRIFYEISAQDMKDAGIYPEDLVELWLTKEWRWQRNGMPRIKFMTWQWIR
ncbi:uncharacterized protein FTJAE_5690 [Fusarium tjaetaba]|uniref:2EXR domain-containing protein n=1 Tax=Fusarium tjaetaba TaxID=1567544 RepID=A0A8H5RQK1_9HYPO|nr:uncharacterized protein FTJAE_5690 [Fusarium tjaetaba]KAF5637275.1 hypothetical protein FTJAE_5690 [Fusarium tjaetaba]